MSTGKESVVVLGLVVLTIFVITSIVNVNKMNTEANNKRNEEIKAERNIVKCYLNGIETIYHTGHISTHSKNSIIEFTDLSTNKTYQMSYDNCMSIREDLK